MIFRMAITSTPQSMSRSSSTDIVAATPTSGSGLDSILASPDSLDADTLESQIAQLIPNEAKLTNAITERPESTLQIVSRGTRKLHQNGHIALGLRRAMTNSAASDLASALLLDTAKTTVLRSEVMTASCAVACAQLFHRRLPGLLMHARF